MKAQKKMPHICANKCRAVLLTNSLTTDNKIHFLKGKKQMNTSKEQQDQQIRGATTIDNVIQKLWQSSYGELSNEELRWFSSASTTASNMLQNIEQVVDGVGCLIAGDMDEKGRIQVGAFSDSANVTTLLFHISQSVAGARALLDVGDDATSLLMQRLTQKQRD